MVLYTPPIQRLPVSATPPTRERRVAGISKVAAQATGERDARQGRSLRQRLIDMVMDEVEEFPDLTQQQRDRIRGNLDRFADRQPAPGGQQETSQQPPPDTPSPPPMPQPPADPLAVTLSAISDGGETSSPDNAEAVKLAQQMRRLLELHSEQAKKIASYIHALQAMVPETHQLTLEA
ncbi:MULTISPECIES: hypothetical protein [unclassified Azospirillum]|uniref:hypothetical protein n=1 Tax=unclassified Azospirillum TaxID=2630922 RepID=UPI000B6D4A55|nr:MULTISPECIES: hypothetical protein [unclassified Azospirillum]SNS36136.1 hypothetical protein SAMN05880556_10490 [Azospirillum sp. RU38E]SNS54427.1 hypothetical protein SAMN05880591_10490 [Azospirillum sp. RU37A]